MNNKKKLSIITAVYNEELNIQELYNRILSINGDNLNLEIEIIFVDDHSEDNSLSIIKNLADNDKRVKWIKFSKNFGSHKAFTAGLDAATGDAAVILASDLQDPPETIPELVEKWQKGAKIVWAVREEQPGESQLNKWFSSLYYKLMKKYAVPELPETGADFFLLDKVVLDTLKSSEEKHISLMALIQWMGFSQDSIFYKKQPRKAGVSKWNFWKKIKLFIDSFVAFSFMPIRLVSIMGFLFSVLGFIYAIFLILRWIIFNVTVEGWTSLICVVLLSSGIQMIMLGIIGEYLWRTLEETRKRPRYIIEEKNK